MNRTQQAENAPGNLGENIRKLRVLHSLSQEYMASNLQMSQGNYARMENGDISINNKRLGQIATVLGYTLEFIANFDSEKLIDTVVKKEKPVELLNFNISIELKELYEARIKVLEKQLEQLKSKMEDPDVLEHEEPAPTIFIAPDTVLNPENDISSSNEGQAIERTEYNNQTLNTEQAEIVKQVAVQLM